MYTRRVRSMMRMFWAALLFLVGSGCQTFVPEENRGHARARATAVTVVAPDEADGLTDDCEKVADLSVRLPFPFLAQRYPELSSFGQAEVEAELRSRAVLAGGDTVVPTGLVNGRTHADAYDCGRAE